MSLQSARMPSLRDKIENSVVEVVKEEVEEEEVEKVKKGRIIKNKKSK